MSQLNNNVPRMHSNCYISVLNAPISKKGIFKAISHDKSDKAVGSDDLPAGYWKWDMYVIIVSNHTIMLWQGCYSRRIA